MLTFLKQGSQIRVYNVDDGWKVQKNILAQSLRWTITDTSLSPDQRYLVSSLLFLNFSFFALIVLFFMSFNTEICCRSTPACHQLSILSMLSLPQGTLMQTSLYDFQMLFTLLFLQLCITTL